MHWAIFGIPLERRLQTAAAAYFVFNMFFAPFYIIFIVGYLLFFTSLWWLVALYFLWYIYDKNSPELGGYQKQWYRNSMIVKNFAKYFPVTLEKTVDLSPDENYIIGCHPHGIICMSHYINFCTEGTDWSKKFPGIKSYICTLPVQFWFPIRRELYLLNGCISSSAQSIEHVLKGKKGNAVAIVLGGAKEALDSHPGVYDLTLSKRKGFIKLAIRNGATLVPVYSFGENNLYYQADNPRGSKLRNFQEKFKQIVGFSPVFFIGRGIFNYDFGVLPYRTPIKSVVGKPIPVTKNSNPTQEEIDRLHKEYCTELVKLFDQYKESYGISEDVKLNIL